ncbi:hypothetical protein IKF88_00710 [Candidatus Saccharibacteria bacterium]|nr:hypothetical protein [Candidatus Saccharibacteria bacterium]
MFFESPSEILNISERVSCAIFVMPKDVNFTIKNAIILTPEEKTVITIEQVRTVLGRLSMKQITDQYVIIRPADAMGDEAANAFLKTLEEPKDKVHFILITDSPSKLLPTILSRAEIYFLKSHEKIDGDIKADEKVKALAKRLIVARPGDLVGLAEEITKKKDGVRSFSLEVLAVAIEMLYKSYFITGKDVFVKKIPKFLRTYENIERNGHIKLHLVADLL